MSSNKKTYLSNGRVLQSPPPSVRVNRFLESIYLFIGLYLVSLFTFDPYNTAKYSRFNIAHPGNDNPDTRPRWRSSGFGGRGGGGGGPRGGDGKDGGPWNKKVGRVDDIRGPECGSCK